jgi:hypothetical protein
MNILSQIAYKISFWEIKKELENKKRGGNDKHPSKEEVYLKV